MDGVFIIDKPQGLTSFDVVARVRRATAERRVGHAGTLDPLATGVLLVCVGEATKLVPYLMDADKEYRAIARLGVVTDTDDADAAARVLHTAPAQALAALTPAAVTGALFAMVGEIEQRPPRFSALKVAGERLYTRARAGRRAPNALAEAALEAQLDGKLRTVRIDALHIEEMALAGAAPQVTFTVRCGKGTYIRALARDLGERLGVGAHLTALRRLRVGRFGLALACTLDALGAARPLSLAAALGHLPQVLLRSPLAQRLRQGQRTALAEVAEFLPADASAGTAAAALDEQGRLVAVVVKQGGAWVVGRGFAAEPHPP